MTLPTRPITQEELNEITNEDTVYTHGDIISSPTTTVRRGGTSMTTPVNEMEETLEEQLAIIDELEQQDARRQVAAQLNTATITGTAGITTTHHPHGAETYTTTTVRPGDQWAPTPPQQAALSSGSIPTPDTRSFINAVRGLRAATRTPQASERKRPSGAQHRRLRYSSSL